MRAQINHVEISSDISDRLLLRLFDPFRIKYKDVISVIGCIPRNVHSWIGNPETHTFYLSLLFRREVDSNEVKENGDIGKKAEPAVDYALYKKFWSLQDFFRNPNQCAEREKWLLFASNAAAVLKVFSQHKLENVAMKKKPNESSEAMETEDDNIQVYFAKNLTR